MVINKLLFTNSQNETAGKKVLNEIEIVRKNRFVEFNWYSQNCGTWKNVAFKMIFMLFGTISRKLKISYKAPQYASKLNY
jgi:hypothetical protein